MLLRSAGRRLVEKSMFSAEAHYFTLIITKNVNIRICVAAFFWFALLVMSFAFSCSPADSFLHRILLSAVVFLSCPVVIFHICLLQSSLTLSNVFCSLPQHSLLSSFALFNNHSCLIQIDSLPVFCCQHSHILLITSSSFYSPVFRSDHSHLFLSSYVVVFFWRPGYSSVNIFIVFLLLPSNVSFMPFLARLQSCFPSHT